MLNELNKISPYAVYIVDTHGSMFIKDFLKLYNLFENILNKNIKIGFHSHNNMQLSYSIAMEFINIAKRDIIIDASIYGMGRGAGNLNTELILDYLNKFKQRNYKLENILYLIDKYFLTLKHKYNWGYSLEYFLSSSYECHPNYVTYLINKKHLLITDIKNILSKIPNVYKNEFNKDIIENIYYNYNLSYISNIVEPKLDKNKKILLIGPGENLIKKIHYIKSNKNQFTIIALNFVPDNIDVDYIFFNSSKRFLEFIPKVSNEKVIVSSNIKINLNDIKYILDYKKLITLDPKMINDNAAVMIINYLKKRGFKEVLLAGIDGFSKEKENYLYKEYDKVIDSYEIDKLNNYILEGLKYLSKKIKITFITDSLFKYKLPLKVVGVIPARYGSTRLPGKPLKKICGIPMIVHVLKRASMSEKLDELYVATDDEKIYDIVIQNGGRAIMTSKNHQNGTLRMCEVSQKINGDIFVLINGDEALLNPKHIDISIESLKKSDKQVSLLFNKFYKKNSPSDFKVVINQQNEIMYISRSDIPSDYKMKVDYYLKAYHIMAFKKELLDIYPTIKETRLDRIESHELLRLIENGYKILGIEVESSAISVDTIDDLEYVRKIMKDDELFKIYKNKVLRK